jgi:hypothetical protein
MIRAKESSKERGYFFVLNMRKLHKGIVKGNRVRVNVQCSALCQEKKGTRESRFVGGCTIPALAVVTENTASFPEPMLPQGSGL